jgi:cellobiose PTS system EIIA component
MDEKTVLEDISLQMISAINEARGYYLKAVQTARAKDFAAARKLIGDGDERYNAGHAAHLQLLQLEAAGNLSKVNLLIMHAEDQLMSTEGYKVLAVESIHIYEAIANK